MPEDYQSVPVSAAQTIADAFGKDVVVIFTLDHAARLAHYTTFGKSPNDKLEAAGYGDLIAAVISAGRLNEATVFEDWRLEAARNKAALDGLLRACEALLEGYRNLGGECYGEDVRAVAAAVAAAKAR